MSTALIARPPSLRLCRPPSSCAARNFSASSAAMQPKPAAVVREASGVPCREIGQCIAPGADVAITVRHLPRHRFGHKSGRGIVVQRNEPSADLESGSRAEDLRLARPENGTHPGASEGLALMRRLHVDGADVDVDAVADANGVIGRLMDDRSEAHTYA